MSNLFFNQDNSKTAAFKLSLYENCCTYYASLCKIFIKENLTRSYKNNGGDSDDRMDTSPQIMLTILKQLINGAALHRYKISNRKGLIANFTECRME